MPGTEVIGDTMIKEELIRILIYLLILVSPFKVEEKPDFRSHSDHIYVVRENMYVCMYVCMYVYERFPANMIPFIHKYF